MSTGNKMKTENEIVRVPDEMRNKMIQRCAINEKSEKEKKKQQQDVAKKEKWLILLPFDERCSELNCAKVLCKLTALKLNCFVFLFVCFLFEFRVRYNNNNKKKHFFYYNILLHIFQM